MHKSTAVASILLTAFKFAFEIGSTRGFALLTTSFDEGRKFLSTAEGAMLKLNDLSRAENVAGKKRDRLKSGIVVGENTERVGV